MVLADSGFWIALFGYDDRHFAAARTALTEHRREGFITTVPVLTEVSYYLVKRTGPDTVIKFLDAIEAGAAAVFDLSATHRARVPRLMDKYRDLPMDYADASLVLLAEDQGHGRILTTDQRDFRAYRWKHRKPFENLLLKSGAT
jgi:predicted nucleic acid-binding protein